MEVSQNSRSSLSQNPLKPLALKQRIMLPILMIKNVNTFKNIFCSIDDDLLTDLTLPSLRFGLHLVRQYNETFLKFPNSKFKVTIVSEETALKRLKDMGENKAACLNNLSGNVFEVGAGVLAKPISLSYLEAM